MNELLAGPRAGEPDWTMLLADPLDIVAAREHWGRVTEEMREAGRWSPANEHAVARLVIAWIVYDRAARSVLEDGAVVPSAKTKVPQYNLHYAVMNSAAELAARLEGELMISPRRRGKVPMKAARSSGQAPKLL